MLKKYQLWALLLLIIAGCCPPCEKEDLGDFSLREETQDWMGYTVDNNRIFVNADGLEEAFSYTDPFAEFDEMATNCDPDNDCGFCCNQFRSGVLFTQMANANQTLIFNITLTKDFLQYHPTDDPLAIKDMLSISFNSRLNCDFFGLPDTASTAKVELNGETINNVFICEDNNIGNNPTPLQPVAFYFTKDEGIVGYKLGNGSTWKLK